MTAPPPRRPWRKRKRTWAALALAFVALGYLSNAATSAVCERATSRWLAARLAARPTNWPGRQASNEPATYHLPWLASVEYRWVVGDLGMDQGRWHYLCLFGYALPLRNEIEIQA